ncbi:unnamed protein product, partial [Symbiodinium pilosum]
MITAAWQYAAAHNLLRVNKIHKEEEARLVLNETFQMIDETGSQITMEGSFEVEDESGFLLESDMPEVGASTEAILRKGVNASSDAGGHEIAGQAASFKLRQQMSLILQTMQKNYKDLTSMQAEAITSIPNQPFNDKLLKLFAEITKQDVVMGNYVTRSKTLDH